MNFDEYSRYACVNRVRATSDHCVLQVLSELFSTLGSPTVYKTDNGPPFPSSRLAEFAKQFGFTHRRVTPYWPRANGEVERFMANLGKVIRAAKLTDTNVDVALQAFLRAYRDTPHSSTGVAPNALMFGRSRTSGLPEQLSRGDPFAQQQEQHAKARTNDDVAKAKMKADFDARKRARECNIRIGDSVALKLNRTTKSTPDWDPRPFVVVDRNHSMITAEREGETKTRNSSFFKRVLPSLLEEDEGSGPEQEVAPQSDPTPPPHATEDVDPPPQVQPEAATTQAAPAQARRRVGRPSSEISAQIQGERAEAELQRRLANPPTRFSERLRDKKL
jgi:hypothetical protein